MLVEAALGYAGRGWAVLPLHSPRDGVCSCGDVECPSPAKHPRTRSGLKDASTDETVIRAWWKKWPDANIGLRTGEAFDVLDIDGEEGRAYVVDAAQSGGLPSGPWAETGGGGDHLLFKVTGSGNRAGILPKVDWRGRDGYIVAPPSLHFSGTRYRWSDAAGPDAEITDAPEWLAAIVVPKKAEERPSGPVRLLPTDAGEGTAYGIHALDQELASLSMAREGTRNSELNNAAFNLFQLVAGGELKESVVLERLRMVGIGVGLGEREVDTTIASGSKAGMQRPRSAPEVFNRRSSPKASTEKEPPPSPESDDQKPPPTLALRWITDVFKDPPVEPQPLIDGLLRAGELCVIGAPRAVGKTMLAMNMATLLGRGSGMLAGQLRIARRCNVLYAQGELDEWAAYERWYRMAGGQGPPPGVAETYDRWRIKVVKRRQASSGGDSGQKWSESDEFLDAVCDPRLERSIAMHKVDVLIIDPWAVYYSGQENSSDETEEALSRLRDLSLRYGFATVIFHHIGKNREAEEPEDLWRGSSRLADWASTRVTILPHYTKKQASDMQMTRQEARRFVDVFLLRRGAPTPDFSMTINHKTGWWEPWTPPGRPAAVSDTGDTAMRCYEAGGWGSIAEAAASLGAAYSTAKVRIDKAVLEGLLVEVEGKTKQARRFVPAEEFLESARRIDEEDGDVDDLAI